MNNPCPDLLKELKRQELVAKDKARAQVLLQQMLTSLQNKSEVISVTRLTPINKG